MESARQTWIYFKRTRDFVEELKEFKYYLHYLHDFSITILGRHVWMLQTDVVAGGEIL